MCSAPRKKAGKAVSKDKTQGKATLVSRFGYEDARHKAQALADRAVEALSTFDGAADTLRLLPHYSTASPEPGSGRSSTD